MHSPNRTQAAALHTPKGALPGTDTPLVLQTNQHAVHQHPLQGDFSAYAECFFGMGCFWGAESAFWSVPGVYTTAVGYSGGCTPNPTYQDVCTGLTGHAEVVRVIYAPNLVTYTDLLRIFWEKHDPTQGMRQGNDFGTQYRSLLACSTSEQYAAAQASRTHYQQQLQAQGYGMITTEIYFPLPTFFYAEDAHQQYLAKHPEGYCGLGGTGVHCALR